MGVKWHKLGEFIEVSTRNNKDEHYGTELIEGVNSSGDFCEPKANLDGINLKPYKIVNDGDFVYNPSRINIGSLSYRTTGMCIVSHLYVVFRLSENGKKVLIPEFLWLFFNREEFRRLITYRNFGSQRPEFNFKQMSDIEIPVPGIEEQRKVVEVWQRLRKMKEDNEKLAEPLMQLCRSYLQECKKKYEMVEIGGMIKEENKRNEYSEYGIEDCLGVVSSGTFEESRANLEGIDFSKYKIVNVGCFAYNPSRINLGSIALRDKKTCIVSPMYVLFSVKDSRLLPDFLNIWFKRPEFMRSTLFFAVGSVRDTFAFSDMCRVKIPLPPIDVQEAIVDVYRAANEAKKIAAEADRLSREICPALIQRVIKEAV